jgi:ABC-2 type transport system ATP-binding protein
MTEIVLRAAGVTKRYGRACALQNVDLEIKRGQIYGLIGLNGAGKTTFMRAVMGLIALDGGQIELFGESGAGGLRRERRKIGQSIETPALYPQMTAAQNLEIQRIIGGVPGKSAVTKTLQLVGLAESGRKRTKNFSLGMKQRLALGIALITNPELLILDEPTNGLDPQGIIEIRNLCKKLAGEYGVTLLISSHILDELSLVATHYGIIHNGRMVKQLSAEDLARESRQYMSIVSDNPGKALALLREKFAVADCAAAANDEIRVFEKFDSAGDINRELVMAGITVRAIVVAEQRLEDYFIALTGGEGQ